ncbi:MAG: glycine--tRNA ligase [bacterium]
MADKYFDMKQIVSLCKRRGIVFPGSEIYGGLANTWDYGPYGVEFKNNVKQEWWRAFVTSRDDIVGLDSAIFMNPRTWEASGHVASFADPLMDCKKCRSRFRGDHLLEEKQGQGSAAGLDFAQIHGKIKDLKINCPKCGNNEFTEPRAFNLMFKTFQGVVEDSASEIFLRPETAQGIFVNFKNIYVTCRQRVPFGVAQIGKAFRNEITPGNFTFRTREFEQMELEYFCKPGTELDQFMYWKEFCLNWLLNLNLNKDKIRLRDHDKEELSHYSNATSDIEYKFPFGWGEVWGIASRTDYDLKQHMKFSGEDLQYVDQANNERYVPFVVEPSLGVDRVALTFLTDAYDEETVKGEKRTLLRLHPRLAPVKLAILPLSNKDPLAARAREIYEKIRSQGLWNVEFDRIGSIGKRYRRQDELGTPFCATFDFDSLEDNAVTIRERDTMAQERIPIDKLSEEVNKRI